MMPRRREHALVDIRVTVDGSVVSCYLATDTAKAWMRQYCPQDVYALAWKNPHVFEIDHLLAPRLGSAMQAAGLVVAY